MEKYFYLVLYLFGFLEAPKFRDLGKSSKCIQNAQSLMLPPPGAGAGAGSGEIRDPGNEVEALPPLSISSKPKKLFFAEHEKD